MRLTLERMHISNFKGIRDLKIDFGDTTRIFGMNGAGKTTIPDAFCWCIWNTDSRGNAPGTSHFKEKPLDENGEEIHNLDTTVELDCRLDGQPFNLRRTQRENWVKKRGSTEATYQGNVSTYWINDVETKLTDFKSRISQIASEEVFRLIGSLSAFNALDWKKRREQLISLSDMDVDAMLLQRDEYREIADECAQRGIQVEDLRKVLADQRKRTNAELQSLPIRIDEARKALPDIKPDAIKDAEYIVKESQADIDRISGYIAEAKAQSGAAAQRERILTLETELLGHKRRLMDELRTQRGVVERQVNNAKDAMRRASDALVDTKRRIEADETRLAKAAGRRDTLRKQYSEQYEQQFSSDNISDICPTCGQALPTEQVEAAIEKARTAFEEARKNRLAAIKKDGIEAAQEISTLTESLERMRADRDGLEKQVDDALSQRDAAYKQLNDFPPEPDYSAEPRIAELEAQINQLKEAFNALPEEKILGYERRKAELQEIVNRNRDIISRRDAGIATEQRIKELEQQQREAADRIGAVEQRIMKVEQFTQDRCHVLEDSINAKFPTLRWKLFDVQINGGITDTCICMIPCESGLVTYGSANTAAQINADVEIINVLSAHYDVAIPLFVDNSERVNRIAATETQLITLSVSNDSDLRIEHKEAI